MSLKTLSKIKELRNSGVLNQKIEKIERDLEPIVDKMIETGIKIDPVYFELLDKEITEELEKTRKKIYFLAKQEFNLNSPRRIARVFFKDLKIQTIDLRKTETLEISTSTPELKKIKDKHEIIGEFLHYRMLNKMHSVYIKTLPDIADRHYRVHSDIDQLGAATGRMTSSSPNLQNIPIHSEWGRKIRAGFIPEKGWSFLACDYSQIELRLVAHIAKESVLLESFRKGEDIHARTASEIFKIPIDMIDKETRFRAKVLNFGLLYGMSPMGFARAAGISTEEATDFIVQYFKRFSNIKKYLLNTITHAKRHGHVETIWGRKRFFPDINSEDFVLRSSAERMAINHPIQGTCADIIKKAMIDVQKKILTKDKNIKLILQVHDELIFEVKDENVQQFAHKLKDILKNSMLLDDVDLLVESKSGKNWRDLQ